MGILEKLTARRKAAEQTAEEQYRELVAREAAGKLPGDDNTVAHVEDVLTETGRSAEDFALDANRIREQHALEREVAKEPTLRTAFAKVREEMAAAEETFAAARTVWEAEERRLQGGIARCQNELAAVGKARDKLKLMNGSDAAALAELVEA